MDNIVRLGQSEILHLAENLTRADMNGNSVRVMTGTDRQGRAFIKWDAGSGWTPPYYSIDVPQTTQSCRKCDLEAEGKFDGAAGTLHTCGQPG